MAVDSRTPIEADERWLASVDGVQRHRHRTTTQLMSWFVVSLRYVAPPGAIDAAMRSHVAFLEKQRKAGIFIVWGRKVPRTGGIILARGESRAAIEHIMSRDPFVARHLAEIEVTEFLPKPSAVVEAVHRLLAPKQGE